MRYVITITGHKTIDDARNETGVAYKKTVSITADLMGLLFYMRVFHAECRKEMGSGLVPKTVIEVENTIGDFTDLITMDSFIGDPFSRKGLFQVIHKDLKPELR